MQKKLGNIVHAKHKFSQTMHSKEKIGFSWQTTYDLNGIL